MNMQPNKTKPEGFLGGLAQRLDKIEFDNDKMEKAMTGCDPSPIHDAVGETVVEVVLGIIETIIDG